jgi:hypothetical protein
MLIAGMAGDSDIVKHVPYTGVGALALKTNITLLSGTAMWKQQQA